MQNTYTVVERQHSFSDDHYLVAHICLSIYSVHPCFMTSGVVPGRGVCSAPPRSRRVTFMVGFWKRIQSVFLPEGCAGPGQPFPGTNREYFKGIHEGYQGSTSPESYNVNSESQQQKYTWHQEMGLLQSPDSELDATGCSPVSPIAIPNIWEPVVANSSDEPSTMIKAHYKSCFQGF
mmetsp:Transcript_23029/g.33698  ORF Transcript_23029/g.33698 Transcript_23029/m.33698 type:complete len:177 (-) Transcript_23029:38-568(-)